MTLLQTGEEISCDASEPNAPDTPVFSGFLACGKAGAHKIIDQATGRGPGTADRGRDLTDGGLPPVGDEVHRDQLREGQLAPPQLV